MLRMKSTILHAHFGDLWVIYEEENNWDTLFANDFYHVNIWITIYKIVTEFFAW